MSSSVRFMVVGTGWRARFFLDLAPKLEQVDLAGVVVHQSCTPDGGGDPMAGSWIFVPPGRVG